MDWRTPEDVENDIRAVVDIRKKTGKPVMAIVPFWTPGDMEQAKNMTWKLKDGGVPAFTNPERGAHALRNALDYYRNSPARGFNPLKI